MQWLSYVYFTYMFISIYLLALFLILFVKNKKAFFEYPETKKNYSVSFVVPAYNEGKSIEECIKHIFDVDYDNIIEVIVVNDCSTDNTIEIVERLKQKYAKLVLINNIRNLGNAARSQNVGLKHATGDLIAVVDADSFPARDSLKKMIGFFDDAKVGVVTCPVLVRNKTKFWEKLQAIEYVAISFGRKLLEYVDAIYVTPGPLALYRKKALLDIGGFDENNLTQDIEATWHVTANGWDRKMSLSTYVSTNVPTKFKEWWVQRRRWNIGGFQCLNKYKKHLGKGGMLGFFIIPFFVCNLFLGLLGLGIFFYLAGSKIFSNLLFTGYSIQAGTPVLTLNEFYITPSFLNYLGIILFVFELLYLIMVLAVLKERVLVKENILNIPLYLFFYLIIYPFIIIDSSWNMLMGKKTWG